MIEATWSIRLTQKEEAFCIAVLSGQNPSDAYRAAYRPKRAKAKTIHEMASRLMAKRKVRTRIAELMQPVIQRAQLTREQWLESLARICLADVRKMFDEHGNPIPITELGSNEAGAMAAFEVYSGLADRSDGVGGRRPNAKSKNGQSIEGTPIVRQGNGVLCRPTRDQ
jgi:hypothetical protein